MIMINGRIFDIKRLVETGSRGYILSLLLEMLEKKDEAASVPGQDVHDFSSKNRALLAKGLAFLREQTESIVFQKEYKEGGIDKYATDAECRQFYDEYLKPALEALLKDLDSWVIKASATHDPSNQQDVEQLERAVQTRDEDRAILKGYIQKLIRDYDQSPKNLAAEEIVRLYVWKKDSGDPQDVFAVYSVLAECFHAYGGDAVSCKAGIMERIRRDAGLFALSLDGDVGICLESYYAGMIDGFLDENGKPGRYLQQLTILAVLEEFEVKDCMEASDLLYVDLELIVKLWPKIQTELDKYVEALGLPWVVARFKDVRAVQVALLNDTPTLLTLVEEGVRGARDDLNTMILMGCFSRASREVGEEAVIAHASRLAGERLEMGPVNKGELKLLREAEKMLEAKANMGSKTVDETVEEVRRVLGKAKGAISEEIFMELQELCYDVRKGCFDDAGSASILKAVLPSIPEDQVISCLSPKHISEEILGNIEARLYTDHDNSVDTVVSVIEKLISLKAERAADFFVELVEHFIDDIPMQIVSLYHTHPSLREALQLVKHGVALKDKIRLAVGLEDEIWLEDLIKDMPYTVFTEDEEYEELYSPLVGKILLKRELAKKDVSHDVLLHLAVKAKDLATITQLIKKMSRSDIETFEDREEFKFLPLSEFDQLAVSDEVVETYCKKTELSEIKCSSIDAASLRLAMLSGIGSYVLLEMCDDDYINAYKHGNYGATECSLLRDIIKGRLSGPFSRAEKVLWVKEVIRRTRDIDFVTLIKAIGSKHIEHEILPILLDRVGYIQLSQIVEGLPCRFAVLEAVRANRPKFIIERILEMHNPNDFLKADERMFISFFASVQDDALRKQLIDKCALADVPRLETKYGNLAQVLVESVQDEDLFQHFLTHLPQDIDTIKWLWARVFACGWGVKTLLGRCHLKLFEEMPLRDRIQLSEYALDSDCDKEDIECVVRLIDGRGFLIAAEDYRWEERNREQFLWFIEALSVDAIEDDDRFAEAFIEIVRTDDGEFSGRASSIAADILVKKWPDKAADMRLVDALFFQAEEGCSIETIRILMDHMTAAGRIDLVEEMIPMLLNNRKYEEVLLTVLPLTAGLKLREGDLCTAIKSGFSAVFLTMVLDKIDGPLSSATEKYAIDSGCSQDIVNKIQQRLGGWLSHT